MSALDLTARGLVFVRDERSSVTSLRGPKSVCAEAASIIAERAARFKAADPTKLVVLVDPINHLPVFATATLPNATAESVYSVTLSATDEDGDPISFSAITKPSWLTLTDNHDGTLTLSGMPFNMHAGTDDLWLRDGDVIEVPEIPRDQRATGIDVPSLRSIEKELISREIEFDRQRGIVPGQVVLYLQDPAGNWLQVGEIRAI